MCGPVDLLILLNLCIDALVGFLASSILFLVRFRGATTKAPHDIRAGEPFDWQLRHTLIFFLSLKQKYEQDSQFVFFSNSSTHTNKQTIYTTPFRTRPHHLTHSWNTFHHKKINTFSFKKFTQVLSFLQQIFWTGEMKIFPQNSSFLVPNRFFSCKVINQFFYMHVFFDIVERFPNDKRKRRRWPLINFQFKNVCFIYLASLSSLLLECTMKYFRCFFYKNLSISNKFLNKNNIFKKWNSHSFVFQYNQMYVTRNFNKRRQTRDYFFLQLSPLFLSRYINHLNTGHKCVLIYYNGHTFPLIFFTLDRTRTHDSRARFHASPLQTLFLKFSSTNSTYQHLCLHTLKKSFFSNSSKLAWNIIKM